MNPLHSLGFMYLKKLCFQRHWKIVLVMVAVVGKVMSNEKPWPEARLTTRSFSEKVV